MVQDENNGGGQGGGAPAPSNSPSPPASPPPPPPPSEADLAKAVEDAEQALAKAKAALDAERTAKKDAAAANSARDAYAAAKPALDETQKGLASFLAIQTGFVEQNAPGVDAKVAAIVAGEEKQHKQLKADLAKAQLDLQNARKKQASVQAQLDDRKQAYDALGKLAAGVRSRQQRADKLRGEVKNAIDAGQPKRAYWLLTQQFAPLVEGEPKLIDPDDLEKALAQGCAAVAAGEQEARSAAATVTSLEGSAAQRQGVLAEFERTKSARIAEALSKADEPGGGKVGDGNSNDGGSPNA